MKQHALSSDVGLGNEVLCIQSSKLQIAIRTGASTLVSPAMINVLTSAPPCLGLSTCLITNQVGGEVFLGQRVLTEPSIEWIEV